MNLTELRQLLTQHSTLTDDQINGLVGMAQKIEEDMAKAKAANLPKPVRTYTTGYYLTRQGELRHCHGAGSDGIYRSSEWHVASNVHPATPDAHNDCEAWNESKIVWAKDNSHISPDEKHNLIEAARKTHDQNGGY